MVRSLFGMMVAVAALSPMLMLADVASGSDAEVTILGPTLEPTEALMAIRSAPYVASAAGGTDLSNRPLLYQNTEMCTVNTLWMAVGGQGGAGGTQLQAQDYFTTSGGRLAAFQILVMNGGPGTGGDTDFDVDFRAGSDAANYGTQVPNALFRTLAQVPSPALTRLPVHEDGNGNALPMLVTVDYDEKIYRVEDWETGAILIEEDIGLRPAPVLPEGAMGMRVIFRNSPNLCGGGMPRAGTVLAGGGAGAEDGIHIINADSPLCSQELGLICPNQTGWVPSATEGERVPCGGGDVCSLNRPFNGIWVKLYASPNEEGDGDNTIPTAPTVSIGAFDGCSTTPQIREGFLGDAGLPNQGSVFFDGEPNGAVNLLDWGKLQDCFGETVVGNLDCVAFDQNSDGSVDLVDHANFVACQGDPNGPGCKFNLLKDLDIYRISGLQSGDVLHLHVEGSKDASGAPVWDPFMRVFTASGELVGQSDDFSRVNLDAYTTVALTSSSPLYAVVSAADQLRNLNGCVEDSDCQAVYGFDSTCGVATPGLCDRPPCNGDTICEVVFEGSTCGAGDLCDMPECGEDMDCQTLFGDDDAVCVSGMCQLPCGSAIDCILAGFGGTSTCGTVTPGRCDPPTCNPDTICEGTPLGEGATCGDLAAGVCDPKRCTTDAECQSFFGDECARCDTMTGFCDADIVYDPNSASSICPVSDASLTGAYRIKALVTDPNCVTDPDISNNICQPAVPASPQTYEGFHEPDDSLDDADLREIIFPSSTFRTFGVMGDGAFAGVGQDVDIFRIDLTEGSDVNANRLQISIVPPVPFGFETVYDLVIALYDSNGNLIANADQSPAIGAISGGDTEDESKPRLQAKVTGGSTYYLAIFGTDRDLWNDACAFVQPPAPPTILNVPHCRCDPCTADCTDDLRPFVGGRANLPGDPLGGCVPSSSMDEPERLQCYALDILANSDQPQQATPTDPDELAHPLGNDAIQVATSLPIAGTSLASAGSTGGHNLGNGPFGGFQGDVDFYQLSVTPGDVIAMNMSDTSTPQSPDNTVRSYQALFDDQGGILTLQDYTLEAFNTFGNGIRDELTATLVATAPDGVFTVYYMVGIDNGNLLFEENIPLFPFRAGTTFSRRFQVGSIPIRGYRIAGARIAPPTSVSGSSRMFVVPIRGTDEDHSEPYIGGVVGPNTVISGLSRNSFPPILEVNPQTGLVSKVLDARPTFRTWRDGSSTFDGGDFVGFEVSALPVIAYDGVRIYVSVETCSGMGCSSLQHPFFWIDPDLTPGSVGFVTPRAQIESLQSGARITGMTVIQEDPDAWVYAFDDTNNRIRYWRSDLTPVAANGGSLTIPPDVDSTFDDVSGDIGTDGTHIYISCTNEEDPVGICKFLPNRANSTLDFVEVIDDPISNHTLAKGPRLGGIDFLTPTQIAASDKNGPILQYTMVGSVEAQGVELPREFTIVRIATSPPN